MKKLLLMLLITTASYSQVVNLKNDKGVLQVPVKMNNILRIHMMIDTGAAECNVPPCIANTLFKAGTISEKDMLPNKNYILADGSVVECRRFIIKSLRIGNKTIYNVECSVSGSESSPLLLGGNAMKKLKVIKIDYTTKRLIISQK